MLAQAGHDKALQLNPTIFVVVGKRVEDSAKQHLVGSRLATRAVPSEC